MARAFPARLANRVTKRFYFRKLLVDNPRSPLQKAHDLLGVVEQVGFGRLRLRSRPGGLICFCGIDGSGKSSHAALLRAALDECEIPNRPVWMRGGYSPFVTWLKARLRGAGAGVPEVGDASGKLRVYRQPRTRLLWGWMVAIEQIVQALLAVRVPRWLGTTLVAERYVPDTLADLSERFDDDSFSQSLPGRLMRWLCPRPDLIVFLDVSGREAFVRKPDDWSEEILEERRRRYRSVLATLPGVRVLDAHRSLDDLLRETIDLGLQTVLEKIRRSNPLSGRRRDGWES
jgi:thymidylate kinase